MKYRLAVLATSLGVALPAYAEILVCPDPSTAVQVAACPSEAELRYTFTGYCSDNARTYGKDSDACTSYEDYRRMKNIALWESADGVFHAYISCDLPAGALGNLKPTSVSITRLGKLTRIACAYPDNVLFTYRTKAHCRVQGDGDCTANTTGCSASCD